MASLHEMLKRLIDEGASDLHITPGTPPMFRVDGRLLAMPEHAALTASDTKQLCYSILTDAQRHRLEEDQELDLSFGVRDLSRFRANIFFQRGAVAGAFRVVPYKILGFEELGLPNVIRELAKKPRGLVLVTGPTGSGKSTTLAAMIDWINSNEEGHIITIEDPIEYVHKHKKSIVNQREVGADTQTFKRALKYILRQDPDVVLIGEMRDIETIEAALTVAETGHLAFGTLHTNGCVQTINRILDVFPPFQQPQVRTQLSMVLEGVVSQVLIPKAEGKGRCAAMEIMIPNPAIRNLIRESKVHQMYSAMQVGQGKSEMQTMNQSLAGLVRKRMIRIEDAMSYSSDQDELRNILGTLGIAA